MTSIKYPIIGYAPGSYYCRCATCGDQFTGDKKAVQCQPCAINMLQESHEKIKDSLEAAKMALRAIETGDDPFPMSLAQNTLRIINQEL